MTPEALSAAYDNAGAVAGARDIVMGWAADSALRRAETPAGMDQPYGPGERQAWDLFPAADPKAPCLVFIHGGYWQMNSRQGFSCMVDGLRAAGWSAALPSHTLAPQASLTAIAAEMRQAMDWLAAEGPRHGIAGPVLLSGWSAGGHLAALLAEHPSVAAVLAVSGIFDLEPIAGTRLNTALSLRPEEIELLSPIRRPSVAKPIAIAYGTAELPELQRQSRDFHAKRAAAGLPGPLLPIADADHFSVLAALRQPEGELARAARDLMAAHAR